MQNSNPIFHLFVQEQCSECGGNGCHVCDYNGIFPKGWYFWDETWTNRHGPYETKEKAIAGLFSYSKISRLFN